ncbi:MAG TPA: GNAT family N-acetyltransferase, partial [Thermoanaerobaculia bacterium]|nr:GNAT family N-acetyltransferase [Thermoanaerobaculia bacterium]
RAIESGDAAALREFFAANGSNDGVPACGLVGKLLGTPVAVMAISYDEPGAVRINDLLVARELRRKRVGRVMVEELAQLAAKMERDWLIAEASGGAREFLRRVGFVERGNQMVRKVGR